MLFPFIHPSTFLLAGPTGCGKTYFVFRILRERLIFPFPNRMIWIFSEWQPLYDEIRNIYPEIEFYKGPLSSEIYEAINTNRRNLLVLDDQMSLQKGNDEITKLFIQGSHHRNLTVMYLVQNLFDKGKQHRTVSLNSQYTVIFKNPRDNNQPAILGRQIFPQKWRDFLNAYSDATEEAHGYLVVDFRQETDDKLRLRTKIFPSDKKSTEIYII